MLLEVRIHDEQPPVEVSPVESGQVVGPCSGHAVHVLLEVMLDGILRFSESIMEVILEPAV